MYCSIKELEKKLFMMKNDINDAKINGFTNSKGKLSKGRAGVISLIRSQNLINHIHELIKTDLIENGIDENLIRPRLGTSKGELKLTGYLKKKNQDVCVIPGKTKEKETLIDWGPRSYQNEHDQYGEKFTRRTLTINVRSQLSSVEKNIDTLLERTVAESINLHKRCSKMVLGEVYLIPVYPYDTSSDGKIEFLRKSIDIEEYISFFTGISHRDDENDEEYKYERTALLIVDFTKDKPKLYTTTKELKKDGLVSEDFKLELEDISFRNFSSDLIDKYSERFKISRIITEENLSNNL